jgi:short-subunit dehydrogenase
MRLVLAALPGKDLATLAAALGGEGKAVPVPVDLAAPDAAVGLAAAAEAAFGAVDVLVNNAGLEITGSFHRRTAAEIERAVEVNLTAPMLLARLLLPGMLARRRGHIINLASLAGKAAPPFGGTYGPTKAALIAFTQSLRAEYQGTGVSASAVCPGFVREVGMFQRIADETGIVAPRLIGTSSPEAVAHAVVRAIRRDVPEILVNPGPTRLFTALAAASPRLGEWLTRRSGAEEPWRRAAAIYEREALS